MSDAKPQGLKLFTATRKPAAPAAGGLSTVLAGPKDVKKRWLYVGAGAIGSVVLLATLFAPEPRKLNVVEKPAAMVNVTPPGADKQAFESAFARELQGVRADVELLRQENARLKALNARDTITPPAGVTPPPLPPGSNTGALPGIGTDTPPAPPVPAFQPGLPPVPTSQVPGSSVLPPVPGSSFAPGSSTPLSFEAPVSETDTTASLTAAAKLRLNKNPNAGQMSIGFAPVALLNGVDAATSSMAQSNPLPVLMNITDHATLPGSSKYRLKSCFVLGTAYGDLSSERVYLRSSRVSCVDKKDRMVLNAEVQGYLVDSDGKLGLRGLISDRQGPRLAKAMLAGFAQGLTGALGQAQGTVLSNLTTGSTTSSITGDAALRASGLAGAQSATAMLAEFYLKEAQSIFPVISVDVGRTGTIVFTSPVKLEWADADSQYVPQVTPSNN